MGCGDLRRLGAVTGGDTDLSIITGSWRSDLFLLIKVARDTELNVNFYTYYAVRKGALTAPGASGLDQVKHVGVWNANNQGFVGCGTSSMISGSATATISPGCGRAR